MKNNKKPLASIDGVAEKTQAVKKKPTKFDLTTNPLAESRDCSYMDYLSDSAFRFFPDKGKWRERLVASLYEWAFQESSVEIMQFCMANRIPYTTFISWTKLHEDVGNAYKEVKLMLATRRRTGALFRKMDKDVVFKDLYRYDPEWIEVDKYNADLKKNESSTDRNITVVIPAMPSVDTVKVKGE